MTSTTIDQVNGARSSLAIKAPCRAATTASITLSGEQAIDGVACLDGDRVLVKDQASGVDNGIYVVSTSAWVRAPDCDGSSDLVAGTLVFVRAGTANIGYWYVTTTGTIVVGTTSIAWGNTSTVLAVISAFWQTIMATSDESAAFAAIAAAAITLTGDITPTALDMASTAEYMVEMMSRYQLEVVPHGDNLLSTMLNEANRQLQARAEAAVPVFDWHPEAKPVTLEHLW